MQGIPDAAEVGAGLHKKVGQYFGKPHIDRVGNIQIGVKWPMDLPHGSVGDPTVKGGGDLGTPHWLPQNLTSRWGQGYRTLWGWPWDPTVREDGFMRTAGWLGWGPQQGETTTGDPACVSQGPCSTEER